MADKVDREDTTQLELVSRYNYAEFVPAKFEPWMNFEASPALGQTAPDFPLWRLGDREEILLSSVLARHTYTVVEFGSFT